MSTGLDAIGKNSIADLEIGLSAPEAFYTAQKNAPIRYRKVKHFKNCIIINNLHSVIMTFTMACVMCCT